MANNPDAFQSKLDELFDESLNYFADYFLALADGELDFFFDANQEIPEKSRKMCEEYNIPIDSSIRLLLHRLGKSAETIDPEEVGSIFCTGYVSEILLSSPVSHSYIPRLVFSAKHSGRTRLALEGLARHWGLYINLAVDDIWEEGVVEVLSQRNSIFLLIRIRILAGFLDYVPPQCDEFDVRRRWVLLQVLPPRCSGSDVFSYIKYLTSEDHLIRTFDCTVFKSSIETTLSRYLPTPNVHLVMDNFIYTAGTGDLNLCNSLVSTRLFSKILIISLSSPPQTLVDAVIVPLKLLSPSMTFKREHLPYLRSLLPSLDKSYEERLLSWFVNSRFGLLTGFLERVLTYPDLLSGPKHGLLTRYIKSLTGLRPVDGGSFEASERALTTSEDDIIDGSMHVFSGNPFLTLHVPYELFMFVINILSGDQSAWFDMEDLAHLRFALTFGRQLRSQANEPPQSLICEPIPLAMLWASFEATFSYAQWCLMRAFGSSSGQREKLLLIHQSLVILVLELDRRHMPWGDLASREDLQTHGIDPLQQFTIGTGSENIFESNNWIFKKSFGLTRTHEDLPSLGFPESLDVPFLLVKDFPAIVCYMTHPVPLRLLLKIPSVDSSTPITVHVVGHREQLAMVLEPPFVRFVEESVPDLMQAYCKTLHQPDVYERIAPPLGPTSCIHTPPALPLTVAG